MQKLLTKLAKGRKAIVAAAVQVGAVVVIFVPAWGHGVQVGIGLLSSLIALALVYRVPNSPELSAALGRAKVGVVGGKRDGTLKHR